MVAFPRIVSLDVRDYQLYPGSSGTKRFGVELERGPWVVLGANGLGKSTLLLLLKHMLIGPVTARSAGFAGVKAPDVVPIDKYLFGVRVEDRARNAIATLSCQIGDSLVEVSRSLLDQSLIGAKFSGSVVEWDGDDENKYRTALATAMGFERFEDALGIIERVLFKLESRIDLLWDQHAQLETFKALLLPEKARAMREIEGRIISADSSARNMIATVNRTLGSQSKEDTKLRSETKVRAKLVEARATLEAVHDSLEAAVAATDKAQTERLDARLYLKRAQSDLDGASKKYEALKLHALQSAFDSLDATNSYLLLKIVAEKICPACGNDAAELATEIENRQLSNKCVICSADLPKRPKSSSSGNVVSISPALQRRLTKAHAELSDLQRQRDESELALNRANEDWQEANTQAQKLSEQIGELTREVMRLERRLPAKDRIERDKLRENIVTWRREIEQFRRQRADAEHEYSNLIAELSERVQAIVSSLEETFLVRAKPFFGDQARLAYSPRSEPIGQTGESFEFPAFEIEMNPGPGYGEFARRSSDQVSLSQREYIDIIFRMSLIEVVGGKMGASFAVDGPEASVDAVFGERAGRLFASFSEREEKSLILACNVVEGALIPETLRNFRGKEKKVSRIVNLLDTARPTAALTGLREEYEAKIAAIVAYRTSR